MAFLPSAEFYLDVARGIVPGMSVVHKFGRNTDIDSGAAEDIWDGGGIYVYPTVARIHDLASTSGSDTAAGTGARTVEVFGLDASFNEVSETKTLLGATLVPTTNSYTRMFRIIVRSGGSGGANVGTITATAQVDGTISAQIDPLNNQTLMALYTVPAAKTAYMVMIYHGLLRQTAAGVDISMFVRPPGEVFQLKVSQGSNTQGTTYSRHDIVVPQAFAAQTDIKMRGDASSNNSDVFGGFDLVLVDD